MVWVEGKHGQLINLNLIQVIDAYQAESGKWEIRAYFSHVFADVIAEFEIEAHARKVIAQLWDVLKNGKCTLNIPTKVL